MKASSKPMSYHWCNFDNYSIVGLAVDQNVIPNPALEFAPPRAATASDRGDLAIPAVISLYTQGLYETYETYEQVVNVSYHHDYLLPNVAEFAPHCRECHY